MLLRQLNFVGLATPLFYIYWKGKTALFFICSFYFYLVKEAWTLKVASQPSRNIPGIFAECSLSVAMFGTSREHLGSILKEKIF